MGDLSDDERLLINKVWLQTRLDRDKSLLTLSSAGIGLLASFIQIFSGINCLLIILYVLGFLSFSICIGTTLTVLRLNTDYLSKLLHDIHSREVSLKSSQLNTLDYVTITAFSVGGLSTILIAMITVTQ